MILIPKVRIPDWPIWNLNTTITHLQMNATYTKVAFMVEVPKSGNISGINYATKGATSSQPFRVSLYSADTTIGAPSTVYGGSAYGTQASVSANTPQLTTLATPAAATQGDIITVVFEWDSTAGDISLATASCSYIGIALPMRFRYSAGAWARFSSDGGTTPTLWFTYSDGSAAMPAGCSGALSMINQALAAAGSPDEYGTSFVPSVDMRVTGIEVCNNGGSVILNYNLYSGNTLLRSKVRNPSQGGTSIDIMSFETPVILKAGVRCHLTVKPESSNAYVYRVTYCSETAKNLQHFGSPLLYCARTDGGAWSYENDKLLRVALVVDAIDIPINRRTSTGR